MKNNNVMTVEESLFSIACRLDELTGNGMGNSYLKLDMEPVELDGIEDKLENIDKSLEVISDRLTDIADNMQSLSSIAESLDNILGWYIEFNQSKKTK